MFAGFKDFLQTEAHAKDKYIPFYLKWVIDRNDLFYINDDVVLTSDFRFIAGEINS
jgi:hypothetical protein